MSTRGICLTFIVMLSAASLSFAQDSFEPDNSYSNANAIATDGQPQSHSIDPAADVDWLVFTLDAPTNVVLIETSGASGDTVMWLYDDQLTELQYDDDGGADYFSRIQAVFPAGTYYIQIQEYNDKALLPEYFVSVLAWAPEIVSVSPRAAARRDHLQVTITGQETVFYQGSSTITSVWFSKGSSTINASSFTGLDATSLTANFDIPTDAPPGKWDVHVSDSINGQSRPLTDGFTVYIYPDLNADGKVDMHDFAFFSSRWMEERTTPEGPEGMVWVYIDDSGAGMTDDYGNPISHGGFTGEMSKYETTNAQYCHFLNAALASGDITVGADNIVYGANGSNGGADFVGEIYLHTYSAISTSQITYDGSTFSVRSRKDIYDNDIDVSNHPVVQVSSYGATAFCNYYGYRLPTEWEWQAVADHHGEFTYGGGTMIDFSKANYNNANPLYLSSYPYTSPVDYFDSYGYGMNDMTGNVHEWTSSLWDPQNSSRVVRGGGWVSIHGYCTVSSRGSGNPGGTLSTIGFRVCR